MQARALTVRLRVFRRLARRLVFHRILHADDPPHRLALGTAIGVFVAFTPTLGIQMALIVFVAWLFRANKAAGLLSVWVSNPASVVPIYYVSYVVGRFLLGHPGIDSRWWQRLSEPPHGWISATAFYWSELMEIALPLWIGGVVVGIAVSVPVYYSTNYLIKAYRLRRRERAEMRPLAADVHGIPWTTTSLVD